MSSNFVVSDFPINKLKRLFFEADGVLILQPQQLSLSLLSLSFIKGIKAALEQNTGRAMPLILCTGYFEFFNKFKGSLFAETYEHRDYLNILKAFQSQKKNLLMVDLTNDSQNKYLFEFGRMTKWPVKQRPFYSQLTFHWENLPQSGGEKSNLKSRYQLLAQEIFGDQIITQEVADVYQLEKKLPGSREKQLCIIPASSTTVTRLPENFLLQLLASLEKRKGLQINMVMSSFAREEAYQKLKLQVLKRKKTILPFKRNTFWHELDLAEMVDFLPTQNLVISADLDVLILAQYLGVKTLSIHNAYSRHFNFSPKLDTMIYPESLRCDYLIKTDSQKGKGYVAPCVARGTCLKNDFCFHHLDLEIVNSKITSLL